MTSSWRLTMIAAVSLLATCVHAAAPSSWTTVLAPDTSAPGYAVDEEFTRDGGRLRIVSADGSATVLAKTAESTSAELQSLYLGHTPAEIRASANDLLGAEILAKPGDPRYDDIARVLPPLTSVRLGTYSFIGTPTSIEKVWFTYGGRSPNFDPIVMQPSIERVVKAGAVRHGLVGSYLPVLRFVYPESADTWTEMLAFAPLRSANANDRVQPVWYRVARIENGALAWARYVDTYQPFPPRASDDPAAAGRFYSDLLALKRGWDEILAPAMRVELPDPRVADMARFGLVRSIMTRVGDYPKYGAVDKDYAGSEHDGFPDTFTVETTAMVSWGLIERAGRYIDNYFGRFVRDDGLLMYRGPETGQFGRMLTVLAQYVDAGGDPALLLTHRKRIDAVTNLLLSLRKTALALPRSNPAYGMLAGWSEADAVLEVNPSRYMQPYLSNSTEAARGFQDLGRVWTGIGRRTSNAELTAWGERLTREAAALREDIATAIARSLLTVDGARVLPAIAGATDPFHIAVQRDPLDPQYRAYRAYMEMMYSGVLTREQVNLIVDYRTTHHDVILGIPTAYGYGTQELAGFLSYGHGYGLIQVDRIREALLMTYSHMAHQYTRGQWLAPETRRLLTKDEAAPYATPAQLVASLMTRWLLVFEEPRSETLWFGKALPREWLAEGKTTRVENAPTRWGRVGFSIESHVARRSIDVRVDLPTTGIKANIRLRLRAPDGAQLKSVTLNGKRWTTFDAPAEVIEIPMGTAGRTDIVARY